MNVLIYFSTHNYDFFHAHFFDFHGHIFFKFSRAKNLFSRTQTHKIFTATFVFSRALLLIFFTGGTPIFTGKKNNTDFNQNYEIFTQNEHLPAQRFFFLSFGRKSKNRPTCCNFEKKIPDPQLHQIFKPIRKFFCTFLLI